MPAPKGNQYWKLAKKKPGPKRKYDPEELCEVACEYFQWVDDNPLKEEKVFVYEGELIRTTLDRMRPFTISGFCLFAKISQSTWSNYCKDEEMLDITTRVRDICWIQKFSGAAAGLLNPKIIARELSLGKNTSVDHKTQLRYGDD